TPAHRKKYSERLSKVLGNMAATDPKPVAMAGFCPDVPLQEGNRKASPIRHSEFYPVRDVSYQIWPMSITPRWATVVTPLVCRPLDRQADTVSASWHSLRLPGFHLEAAESPLAGPAPTPVNVVAIIPQQPRAEAGYSAGRRSASTKL